MALTPTQRRLTPTPTPTPMARTSPQPMASTANNQVHSMFFNATDLTSPGMTTGVSTKANPNARPGYSQIWNNSVAPEIQQSRANEWNEIFNDYRQNHSDGDSLRAAQVADRDTYRARKNDLMDRWESMSGPKSAVEPLWTEGEFTNLMARDRRVYSARRDAIENGTELPQYEALPWEVATQQSSPSGSGVSRPRSQPRTGPIQRSSTDDTNTINIAAQAMLEDSPLMRAADTRGRQFGASRGLLNSSMAGQAATDAALEYVTPLASQESAQRFEDARARQDYDINSRLSRQGSDQDRALARDQFGYDTSLTAQRGDIESALSDQGYRQQLGLNEQEFGFDTQRTAQEGNIQSRLAREAFGFESLLSDQNFRQQLGINDQAFGFESNLSDQDYRQQLGLNDQAFGFDQALSEQDYNQNIGIIDREGQIQTDRDQALFEYERELETIRNQFAGTQADADRALELELQGNEIDANFELADMDSETRRELLSIEEGMRVRLQELENELQSKNISMDAYFTAKDQFNNRLRDIMQDPNMDADERIDAVRAEQNKLNVDIQAIEDMYTIDLAWTDYVPEGAAAAQQAEVRSQIDSMYRTMLGREPEPGGINFYENEVVNGRMTLDEVRDAIRTSTEGGIDSSALLREAYQDIMGREADDAGLNYWLNEINSGNATIEQVRSALQGSDEARLRAAYRDILGQEADEEGLAYWLGEIQSGRQTVASVSEYFRTL